MKQAIYKENHLFDKNISFIDNTFVGCYPYSRVRIEFDEYLTILEEVSDDGKEYICIKAKKLKNEGKLEKEIFNTSHTSNHIESRKTQENDEN